MDTLDYIAIEAKQFSIINNARGFREKILELIQQAEYRIYITALYLQDDESGQEILHAIYQAKQKNPELDVKIFVDFLRAQRGLMGQPKSIGNVRLYKECNEKYEHPIDILGVPVKSKEVFGVLHLKGFIFDDTLLYSGASLNNIYLQQEKRYRCDRYHVIKDQKLTDSMVIFLQNNLLKSSAVKSLTETKIIDRKKLKPLIKPLKKILRAGVYQVGANKKPPSNSQIAITPLLGFGGRKNQLNKSIYELVKNTQESLTIYTPYFNFPSKINKGLVRILKQGKKVDIVVGDKKANDFYIPETEIFNKIGVVPYVYETNLRAFVKKNQKFIDSKLLNIHLWLHEDNSFHLKGISSDHQYHLITGHNINPRAWLLDLENGLLIQDKKQLLKDAFNKEYKNILTHTKRVNHFNEIETIDDYPEAQKKLMRSVKRARIDSILNRLL